MNIKGECIPDISSIHIKKKIDKIKLFPYLSPSGHLVKQHLMSLKLNLNPACPIDRDVPLYQTIKSFKSQ